MDVCSLDSVLTIPKAEAGAGSSSTSIGWEWQDEDQKKRIIITPESTMYNFSGYFQDKKPISLFCLIMDWPIISGKPTSLPIPFEYQLFKYKFTEEKLNKAQDFFLSGVERQTSAYCTGKKDCVIQALSFLFKNDGFSGQDKIPPEMLQVKELFQGDGTESFGPNVIRILNLSNMIKLIPNNSFFVIKLIKGHFPEISNNFLLALGEMGQEYHRDEAEACGVTLIKGMFKKLYDFQLLPCDYKFILAIQYSWFSDYDFATKKGIKNQNGHAVVGYFVKTEDGVEIGILDTQSGLKEDFYLCKGVGKNFNKALDHMFSEKNTIWKASFIVNSCIDIETIGTFTTNHLNSLFDENFTTTTDFWNSYYKSKKQALLDNQENNRMATQSALDLAQLTANPFDEVKLIQTNSFKITLCYFSEIFNQLIRDEVARRLLSEFDNSLITSEMVSNIYQKCFFSYLPPTQQPDAAYSFMNGNSKNGIWFIYQATKKIRGRRPSPSGRVVTQLIILSMLWIDLKTFATKEFLGKLFPAHIQAQNPIIYDIYNVCNNSEFTDAIKGICQKFISQVILFLISINCRIIGLHVRIGKGRDLNEKNYAALKCYLKCGFRIIIRKGQSTYDIWPQAADYINLFDSGTNFKEIIDGIIHDLVVKYGKINSEIDNIFYRGGEPSNPDLNLRMIFGIGNEFFPPINLIDYLPDVTLQDSLQNLAFYLNLKSNKVNQSDLEEERNVIKGIGRSLLEANPAHTFVFGTAIPHHLDLRKFITDFLERVQLTGSPEDHARALFLKEKIKGTPIRPYSLSNNTLQSLNVFFNTFDLRQILYLILIYLAYKPLGGLQFSSHPHSGGNKFKELTKQKKKNKTNKNKKYIKQTKNYKIVKKVKKFKKIKKSKKVKKLKKTNKQKKKY